MQAEKVIIRMTESTIFGMGLVYHAVVKNYDDKLSSRLKKIYLDTLEYMVSNAQPAVIKKEIPGLIVDFAVKKLTDPSNEVRKSAINLLKSLKKQGYEDRIKVCMNEEKSFKESYLKELGIE
jgi:NAD-specific glutamate dehydrogenase